jgi:hypothetical protein
VVELAERNQKIADDYQRGIPLNDIVAKFGLCADHIRHLVRKHGMPPRKTGRFQPGTEWTEVEPWRLYSCEFGRVERIGRGWYIFPHGRDRMGPYPLLTKAKSKLVSLRKQIG